MCVVPAKHISRIKGPELKTHRRYWINLHVLRGGKSMEPHMFYQREIVTADPKTKAQCPKRFFLKAFMGKRERSLRKANQEREPISKLFPVRRTRVVSLKFHGHH